MYSRQAQRCLPMPVYDLSESRVVRLAIPGSEMDPAYTNILMERTDLPLMSVLALDRVQKKLSIPR